MDKKKEITFLGKESSMKQVLMTRNIYSCMNRGVCLPTESSIKNLLVILDEVTLRTFGGKKTSIPNRFCKQIWIQMIESSIVIHHLNMILNNVLWQ